MADNHGDFVWYELAVKDVEAAKAFYGPLLGWSFEIGGQPEMPYHMAFKDGAGIGGMMALTDEMCANGARPTWAGYVEVEDVDAAAKKARCLGATIYVEPSDIPEVGRWSLIADPQGASLYIMRGFAEQSSTSYAKYEPQVGHCAWNELATRDPAAALTFYHDMLGWAREEPVDMGPMGSYHMLRQSDYLIAGVYTMVAEDPVPHWLFYFRVENLTTAETQIIERGGSLHIEAMEIPGGDFSLVGKDPEGVYFGLIGPKGAA